MRVGTARPALGGRGAGAGQRAAGRDRGACHIARPPWRGLDRPPWHRTRRVPRADERPELSKGTYECYATAEYMVRAPQPVIHAFVVDVGHAAVATGATRAACECIEQVLDSLQGEGGPGGRRGGGVVVQPGSLQPVGVEGLGDAGFEM